jgi:membrane protein DedA with SNARE-associated domain
LIESYGLYGVFVLVMVEGDLTLLLAASSRTTTFWQLQLRAFAALGTVGGFASDNLAYGAGRLFSGTVRNFALSQRQRPIERMSNRFGTLSLFLSKYVYGCAGLRALSTAWPGCLT